MINRHPYITATLVAALLAIVVWLCMPKEYTAVTKLSDEYEEMDLAIGINDIKAHIKSIMGSDMVMISLFTGMTPILFSFICV